MLYIYSARAQWGSMNPTTLSSDTLLELQKRGWNTVFAYYISIENVQFAVYLICIHR